MTDHAVTDPATGGTVRERPTDTLAPAVAPAVAPALPLTEAMVLAAADQLITAFAATDTAAYFDCFAPDATFVFHPEASRLDNRAAYERAWHGWLADGWRVLSCESSHRLVQILGGTAVFTHSVHTITVVGDAETIADERETIVFSLRGERLLAVHEHLSTAPH